MYKLENLENLLNSQVTMMLSEFSKFLEFIAFLDLIYVSEILGKILGICIGYSIKYFFIPLISMILLGMVLLIKLTFQNLSLLTEIIYERIFENSQLV